MCCSIPDAVPRAEPRGTRGNPPFYEVFGKRYYVLAQLEGLRRARHGVLVRPGLSRRSRPRWASATTCTP